MRVRSCELEGVEICGIGGNEGVLIDFIIRTTEGLNFVYQSEKKIDLNPNLM